MKVRLMDDRGLPAVMLTAEDGTDARYLETLVRVEAVKRWGPDWDQHHGGTE